MLNWECGMVISGGVILNYLEKRMVILYVQIEVKFLVMFELELDSQRGSHLMIFIWNLIEK